jgi:hypothetical protein
MRGAAVSARGAEADREGAQQEDMAASDLCERRDEWLMWCVETIRGSAAVDPVV